MLTWLKVAWPSTQPLTGQERCVHKSSVFSLYEDIGTHWGGIQTTQLSRNEKSPQTPTQLEPLCSFGATPSLGPLAGLQTLRRRPASVLPLSGCFIRQCDVHQVQIQMCIQPFQLHVSNLRALPGCQGLCAWVGVPCPPTVQEDRRGGRRDRTYRTPKQVQTAHQALVSWPGKQGLLTAQL